MRVVAAELDHAVLDEVVAQRVLHALRVGSEATDRRCEGRLLQITVEAPDRTAAIANRDRDAVGFVARRAPVMIPGDDVGWFTVLVDGVSAKLQAGRL